MKKVKNDLIEIAFVEFKLAKQNLENAQNNFNNANEEYFDIANQELTLAQERFRLAYIKWSKLIR